MKYFRMTIIALALFLALAGRSFQVEAAPKAQQSACRFFTETGGGQGGYSVCDDPQARFLTAFNTWGLQKIGYPISQRYTRAGFVTQAFQKAIMQWRPDGNTVVLVNIFDDLHDAGFDETLLKVRQTPTQLPAGWDGPIPFPEIVMKRQALLDARPAMRATYFSAGDPLIFFGLPTSEVTDMGNHYAIRLQRAVLQEWKEDVPWAKRGQVTIANGGDIAKELGSLPAEALTPQAGPAGPVPTPPAGGYTGPFDPKGQDRNCTDFATQREAQAFYIAAGGPAADSHRLDADNNGIACENLPQ
jgi:hypothetical protein